MQVGEEGGFGSTDAIQALSVQRLGDDGEIRIESEQNCLRGIEKFMDAINGDDVEEVLKYYSSQRDIQEPVWTRWMTTVKADVMVVENWSQIYVTMIVIKSTKKASSHLAKVATNALALMKTKDTSKCNTLSFYARILL